MKENSYLVSMNNGKEYIIKTDNVYELDDRKHKLYRTYDFNRDKYVYINIDFISSIEPFDITWN